MKVDTGQATKPVPGEEPIEIRSTAGPRNLVPVLSSLPGAMKQPEGNHGAKPFGREAGRPMTPKRKPPTGVPPA